MAKKPEVRLTSKVGSVTRKIDSVSRARALEAANIVRNEWLEILSGPRSGRVYFIPGTTKTYVASAPGEAPAVALGDLRRSIKAMVEVTKGEDVGIVGSPLEKAVYLEFGTKKMAPRPSLEPALERSREDVQAALTRKWF